MQPQEPCTSMGKAKLFLLIVYEIVYEMEQRAFKM
jgi:hypothetical protein